MTLTEYEINAAKTATAKAIIRWTLIKAAEQAEQVGTLDGKHKGARVFDAEDLIMFWIESDPQIPVLLLKAGAIDYLEVDDDHA